MGHSSTLHLVTPQEDVSPIVCCLMFRGVRRKAVVLQEVGLTIAGAVHWKLGLQLQTSCRSGRPFFLPSYACIRTGLILRLSTTLVQLDPTLASLPSALQRAYQQDTKTTKRAANPTWEYVPPAEENTTPPPPHVTSASAPPLPTSSQWPHNSNLSSNDRNSD